ncbi:hypothetical protein KAM329D_43980 [Aeromonas caviae]|nr:hypothetical protein CSB94_3274 [Pseudomonas aeruginosa]GJA12795.1 hypothetical protein KAM334_41060 [Aeromonas caviae]AVJ99483.1 hypothetical protein CSB94_3276 [Pseudomonas aeruginosa]GJA96560.1 hypothetical protein KAM358_43920 [Aeromonas caviae]GJC02966.1 hypothetical protein KAM384_42470 [Aeromonas caviae]
MPMPLIASHDEGSPASYRTKAANDQFINVITIWKQVSRAFIK